MRFAVILILALFLSTNAFAQNRGVNCPQRVPCSSSEGTMSPADLNMIANYCLSSYMGFNNPNGFFEETGLDGNNCLTTKSDNTPSNGKGVMQPQCCVTKLQNNTCVLRCEMVTKAP